MDELTTALSSTALSRPPTGSSDQSPSQSNLERLPLEVQLRILRLALPARERFRFWLRARILRSWSLVSRTVGPVAQRELFAHVVLPSDDKLERFLVALEKRPLLGDWVRDLHIEVSSKNGQLRRLAGLCDRIEQLALRGAENLDLVDLNAMCSLQSLRLSACTLKRGKVAAHVWANGLVLPRLEFLCDESQGPEERPALHRCEALKAISVKHRLTVPHELAGQLVAVMAAEVHSPAGPLERVALLGLTEHVVHRPSADRLIKPKPRTWPRSTRILLSHDNSRQVFASLTLIMMGLPLLQEIHLGQRVLARSTPEAEDFRRLCSGRGVKLVGFREDDSNNKHHSTYDGVAYFEELARRVIREEREREKSGKGQGKGRAVGGNGRGRGVEKGKAPVRRKK